MNNFEYKIYKEVYDNIISGIKKVEIRLLNEKSSKIKIGDNIKFVVYDDTSKYINVVVTNLHHFKNVDDLWDNRKFLVLDNIDNSSIIGIEFNVLN